MNSGVASGGVRREREQARPDALAGWPANGSPPRLWQRGTPVPHLKIAALGGGTGLPVLLRGLKGTLFPPGTPVTLRAGDRLTAVVTAADDGGSSGRLRQAYGLVPPGDIRNCLLALSDADPALAAIFGFRFGGEVERDVAGHNLGNLILAALSHLEADFTKAIECATRILAVRGRVLPATLDDVTLAAQLSDLSWVEGESKIGAAGRPIRRVCLRPEGARAVPEAARAIAAADVIVIGPGSLYTSLLPVLLVQELAEAIAGSRARVVLVMNLMSEPGETDGYTAGDVVRSIRRHVPRVRIDDVLLNTAAIPGEAVERYARHGARPIAAGPAALEALGCRPVGRDLLGTGPKVRHDSDKLARALLALAETRVRPPSRTRDMHEPAEVHP